ncbi:MAG: hypothetical protein M1821_006569 [Bathelium mastoideum]|nr:MAG: hypothetical protein M1821_006569 [Bathelium mastoideum]
MTPVELAFDNNVWSKQYWPYYQEYVCQEVGSGSQPDPITGEKTGRRNMDAYRMLFMTTTVPQVGQIKNRGQLAMSHIKDIRLRENGAYTFLHNLTRPTEWELLPSEAAEQLQMCILETLNDQYTKFPEIFSQQEQEIVLYQNDPSILVEELRDNVRPEKSGKENGLIANKLDKLKQRSGKGVSPRR